MYTMDEMRQRFIELVGLLENGDFIDNLEPELMEKVGGGILEAAGMAKDLPKMGNDYPEFEDQDEEGNAEWLLMAPQGPTTFLGTAMAAMRSSGDMRTWCISCS